MDDPDADGDEYDQSNSSEMQAKEEAFTQLAHYVYIMGDAYAPWIVETMDVAMTALRFQWSDGVREVS
jgi:hypothetical protein